MNWLDVDDIVEALLIAHPSVNPMQVRFTDLHAWVLALPGFNDGSNRSNERILEEIQRVWVQEKNDC